MTSVDRDGVKEEIREILVERAKAREVVTYSSLVEQLTSVRMGPNAKLLRILLTEISEDEDKAGRGMLSAVVVRKDYIGKPGVGFFALAERLGKDCTDPDRFWRAERNRVYEAWA